MGGDHHINSMQTLFILLHVGAALVTLFVLTKGVIGMANGADFSGTRSQGLMQKRVLYQAIAILLAVVLMMIGRSA